MTILFDRQIRVEVAGLTIDSLRISLGIEREIDKTQDKGEINIYNLNDEHEERIYDRRDSITVLAGYPQTTAIVFQGKVQDVTKARENLARVTNIKLGDYVRDNNTLSGVYSDSWAGHISVREIAVDIITKGLGLTAGPLDAIPGDATFLNFYWGGQSAGVALSRLLDPVRCLWAEEDGRVRVHRENKLQSDAPSVSISPQTGMIESPIATDQGAECRMFLNPAIRLGSVLTIQARILSGRWKVVGIRHQGDNWSGKFETWVDLRPIPQASTPTVAL